MKTKIFILISVVILLLLAGGLSSCATMKENVCGVNNPLTDLPWLKEAINAYKKSDWQPHIRIYQCTYKDGIGFLWEGCVSCNDSGYSFFNCEGIRLCFEGTESGEGSCREFNIDFENRKLIFEMNKGK